MGGRGASGGGGGRSRTQTIHPMTGSEKQVKWANEIRNNVISVFKQALNEAKNAPANTPKNVVDQTVRQLKSYIDRLSESGIEAGDVISLFKDIKFGQNAVANARSIMSVYRTTPGNSAGERRILGRETKEDIEWLKKYRKRKF